jgi:iron complex outermembrane receptor protein
LFYYQQGAHIRRLPTVGDETLPLFTGVTRSTFEFGASLGDPTSIFMLAAFHPGILCTVGNVETTSYAAFLTAMINLMMILRWTWGFVILAKKKKLIGQS